MLKYYNDGNNVPLGQQQRQPKDAVGEDKKSRKVIHRSSCLPLRSLLQPLAGDRDLQPRLLCRSVGSQDVPAQEQVREAEGGFSQISDQ